MVLAKYKCTLLLLLLLTGSFVTNVSSCCLHSYPHCHQSHVLTSSRFLSLMIVFQRLWGKAFQKCVAGLQLFHSLVHFFHFSHIHIVNYNITSVQLIVGSVLSMFPWLQCPKSSTMIQSVSHTENLSVDLRSDHLRLNS